MTAEIFADWLAICEVKARYCRLLDTKQWDGWAALFTPELVLDTSEAGGPALIVGRDQAVAMVRASIETAQTAHQVQNPEIAIAGDRAEVIWAMQDRLVFESGDSLTGYGHYHETYAKHDGAWRIAKSKLTRLLLDYVPAAQ